MKNRYFRPLTRLISETIQDMATVTMETNRRLYAIYHMAPFSLTLDDP